MKVFVGDLKPGMQLAEDVLGTNGRFLLGAGTVLEEQHLRIFNIWGVSEVEVKAENSPNLDDETDPEILKSAEDYADCLFHYADMAVPPMEVLKEVCIKNFVRILSENGKLAAIPAPGSDLVELPGAPFYRNASEFMENGVRLTSFPDIYYKIVNTLNDPAATSDTLADIISKDSGLSAKLISLVNSPLYGFSLPVDSLSRAVSLVGTSALSQLALSVSVMEAFKAGSCREFSMEDFWKHSLSCAVLSRILAAQIPGISQDKCFVVGMLHDLGRLVMMQQCPEAVSLVFRIRTDHGLSGCEAERVVFGFDHCGLAGELFRFWNFPVSLSYAVIGHHGRRVDKYLTEAAICSVANVMATALQYCSGGFDFVEGPFPGAWDLLGLPDGAVVTSARKARRQMDDILAIFGGVEVDDKVLIEFQRQQIRMLQEEKAAAMEAFDRARELGSFSALSRQQPTHEELLHEICAKANLMIPFKSCAVYLVDSDTQDFVLANVYPQEATAVLDSEVNSLIEDQSFSFALQSEGPTFFRDSTGGSHLLLHSLATSFRVRGMFVGQMLHNKDEFLDTTLRLFSVFMLSAANALENFEIHSFMRDHNLELERKVQKRTQELTEAYDRLDTTLNSMQVGVLVVDSKGHRIVDANPKALEMFGMDWDELIGKECFDVGCTSTRGNCPIIDRGLNENSGECLIERKDGQKIPVQKAVSRVMIGGRLHMVENFIDISEQKKLADLREDVDRIMRHDLKTPLNGIISLPDVLLLDDNLNPDQREILEHIKASGYKLLNMINLSLDLYKMETGVYKYHPFVADIFLIARSVQGDLFELIDYKKLDIRMTFAGDEVDDEFAFDLVCDESLTYSLLSNLFKNAVEASPAEGVISFDVSRAAGCVLLQLHNMGAVPEEIKDVFFDKYVTCDKSGGTGLGTYSAKLITETMGGRIYFESSEDEGTSIFIEFPVSG